MHGKGLATPSICRGQHGHWVKQINIAYLKQSFSPQDTCNRLSDSNLEDLMKIAIKGPSLTDVDLDEILFNIKEKNKHILL